MNKMIYNDLDGEIEYARMMIDRIINFSINYISESGSKIFNNLNINITEYKQTLYHFIEPIVIFHKDKTENYTISQDKIIFLSSYKSFKPSCYELKNKNYLTNIYDVSIYVLNKVLWFFNLNSSENDNITNTTGKEYKTINSFITLFSILLELYFTNHQQLSNLNINTLKQLLNNINSNLNNKIINNKDIINLVSLLSNANYKCRTEILKYFNLDLTERIKQLNELNLKDLKSKNNNEKIDKSVLAKIKSTLTTFISTSALTLVTIKALVNMIALIVEKIPMLSSMINKGSSMISNGINIINDIGNGSINNLFNSSSKTKQTKTNTSEINPGSKHTITNDNKGTIKGFNSKSKNKNNSIKNRNTNNPLGNNNNTSDNPNFGKNKDFTPNDGGSITITPNGSNRGIGNTNNPSIPVKSDDGNKSNKKRNIKTEDLEPEKDITDNPQITTNDGDGTKDIATDNTENNEKIQENDSYEDGYDNIPNKFGTDDFCGFNITSNDNKLDNNQQNLTNSQSPLQDISQNSSENNLTSNQTAIGRSNTDNIDSETNSNKNYDNNLSNNNLQNNTNPTPFQDKLKKENKSNESIIKKVIKEHEENENKSHTEIIKKKGDDGSPDNSPTIHQGGWYGQYDV